MLYIWEENMVKGNAQKKGQTLKICLCSWQQSFEIRDTSYVPQYHDDINQLFSAWTHPLYSRS